MLTQKSVKKKCKSMSLRLAIDTIVGRNTYGLWFQEGDIYIPVTEEPFLTENRLSTLRVFISFPKPKLRRYVLWPLRLVFSLIAGYPVYSDGEKTISGSYYVLTALSLTWPCWERSALVESHLSNCQLNSWTLPRPARHCRRGGQGKERNKIARDDATVILTNVG